MRKPAWPCRGGQVTQAAKEKKKKPMRGPNDRMGLSWRGADRKAFLLSIVLAACAPVSDPSAEECTGLSDQVAPSDVALTTVAETFALGTRATGVQRENLQSALIGRRVEWDIPVYEVWYRDGRYEILSQRIPAKDPDAISLIRVMAHVIPRDDADRTFLERVKTDDVIRLRGIVQEVRPRTIVVLEPAALPSRRSDQ